ncbi:MULTISPECIES: hypothetical protein [Staphylococcus]|uniref:hypothetical protein n=1 Tax=Staphylococcus TaxID=1279 RepID=UPI00048CB740|nr:MULTISPECIES: hypothetical protein [Staphylococcus]
MILKTLNHVLYYRPSNKITEYELLTKYNPKFINRKCNLIQNQINEMYYLNQSHMTCDDIRGVITVSYPIDKLVEWIIESKENLQKYKDRSKVNMNILKQIISQYSKQDQTAIMTYMNSNGRFRPTQLIDKLREDIFTRTNDKRGQRFKEQERQRILKIMKMRKPITTKKGAVTLSS